MPSTDVLKWMQDWKKKCEGLAEQATAVIN